MSNHYLSSIKYTEYQLPDGWIARAGKTDADNDILSIKIAKPNDWWFHVKGMPGSHVILSNENNVEADRELLKIAAAIAAYHSKARTGGTTAVVCTKAMNVSKPSGAKPGTVTIRKEITLKVKPAIPEN